MDEATAGDWYTAMVQNGGYAKDAAFDAEGFKKTLQLRAEIEAGEMAPRRLLRSTTIFPTTEPR